MNDIPLAILTVEIISMCAIDPFKRRRIFERKEIVDKMCELLTQKITVKAIPSK